MCVRHACMLSPFGGILRGGKSSTRHCGAVIAAALLVPCAKLQRDSVWGVPAGRHPACPVAATRSLRTAMCRSPLLPSGACLRKRFIMFTTLACVHATHTMPLLCRLPACLPACPPARPPACLPARPPACPPARPPACLPARLPACPPACLPACLPAWLAGCLCVHMLTGLSTVWPRWSASAAGTCTWGSPLHLSHLHTLVYVHAIHAIRSCPACAILAGLSTCWWAAAANGACP